MNENLLDFAIRAHGDFANWKRFSDFVCHLTVNGTFWSQRGDSSFSAESTIFVSLREQIVVIVLNDDRKIVVEPSEVYRLAPNGTRIDGVQDPRSNLLRRPVKHWWDDLHAGYCIGSSLWHDVSTPFLYASPGFNVEEIEPWIEKGETWRVLKVLFPDSIATYSREQYAYYGPDGLLRRHGYTVDFLKNEVRVNLISAYQKVNGIMIPTEWRIFRSVEPGVMLENPPLFNICLSDCFYQDQ